MLLTKPLYRDASSAVVEITRRTRKGKLKTKGLLLMQAGGERMFALSGTQFSTQFTCFTAANAGRRRAHVRALRYSVYVLYWYKSTSTDAMRVRSQAATGILLRWFS